MGHAADRNFSIYTIKNVLDFVQWDFNENTLFTLWGIVMRQAKKGVPIGGYLSAQLMCIWALVQEMTFLKSPDKEMLIKNVKKMWPRHMVQPEIKPGPVLTFPYPADVPCDRLVQYHSAMRGWFRPEKRQLFQVKFQDTVVTK